MNLPDIIANDLEAIRSRKPLIHSITNLVVMNETANAILCLGALPVMAHAKEEVEEMVGWAGALVLNVGTLEPDWIEAMEMAGKRANERGIPVILDPVGAGATRFRTESCKRLMESVKVSIVRGNAAEVATLAGLSAEIRGVESMSAADGAGMIAGEFASKTGITAAITGAVDVVCDGKRTALISNGHAMMGKVVGTGCISNTIVGSFAAVNDDPFLAAVGGLTTFGIAGETAAKAAPEKPGTFHVELYNALYAVRPADIRANAKVEIQGL